MLLRNRNFLVSLLLISPALLSALVLTAETASTRQAGQNPDHCASVVTEKISCDLKGGYAYTFTVTNNSGGDVQQILLTPPTGSTFTLSQQVFNLSTPLHNTQSTSITVIIGNVTPSPQLCFFLTLMSNEKPCCTIRICPKLPNCCATTSTVSVKCGANGSYTYVLSIVNTSPNTIQHIYLHPPSGVTMTPNYLAVSLAPGDTFTTQVTITGAHPGEQLCFHITLHTADMKECCSVDKCVSLRKCDITEGCVNGVCCARPPAYPGTKITGQKVAAVTGWQPNPSDPVLTVIDLSGANAFNLGTSSSPNNAPPMYNGPPNTTNEWTMKNLGSIFGVTIDHLGNIYVTASSIYPPLPPPAPLAAADFYPNGAGTIYKIANGTGAISIFATLPNFADPSIVVTGLPSPAEAFPALGNISFNCSRKQFFVTNEEDGRIYRLDFNGNVLSTFDHATGVRTSNGNPEVGDPPGFAPLGERLWGVQWHDERIYYSVWKEDCGNKNPNVAVKNEVWSVGLDPVTGDFDTTSKRLEVTIPDLPGDNFSNPISDISFGRDGRMLLASRTMGCSLQSASTLLCNVPALAATNSSAHASPVLEYICTPSDTGSRWTLATLSGSPYKYNVGSATSGTGCPMSILARPANSAGGVDYDYDSTAAFQTQATGDFLHGGNIRIYGLQGFPFAGGDIANSALIDLDANTADSDKMRIGDVEVSCPPGELPY